MFTRFDYQNNSNNYYYQNRSKLKTIDFRSTCPISSTLDLVGDKWSLLIVRDLLYHGARTFKDFSQSEERISPGRLAERLKRLERFEILEKKAHPTNRKVNLYRLTQRGKDLAPVVLDLISWGFTHLSSHISEESKEVAKEIERNREAMVRRFQFG